MTKDLKEALVNIEAKLGGEEKPHMDLGGHLDYIESLLDGIGGGSDLYFDVSPYITFTSETSGTITQEAFNLIQTKLNNGEIIGINMSGTPIKYAYSDIYSVNPNEPLKTKLIFLYNFENEMYIKMIIDETLAWNMEQEPISSGGGEMIDLNEQIDLDNSTITQSGYNLIQQAYENNTLLGISFTLFGLVPIKCMFDYVDIDIDTHTNVYCFKFGAGETYVLKIKSDLTIIQLPQNSFGVTSSFETAEYAGTFATSFESENITYKIPYTLIYPSQDKYKNECLQFRNDTYNKTTYKIPDLPTDASTKNYALNSVNGALTWNTIGNGLEIKNGALISNLSNFKYGTLRLKNITSGANSYTIELSFFDYVYDVIINGAGQLMGTSLTRDTFPSFLKNNITEALFISLISGIIDVHRKAALMPYFDVTIIDQNNAIMANCSTVIEGGVAFFCGTNEINLPNITFGDTFTVEYYGSWFGD